MTYSHAQEGARQEYSPFSIHGWITLPLHSQTMLNVALTSTTVFPKKNHYHTQHCMNGDTNNSGCVHVCMHLYLYNYINTCTWRSKSQHDKADICFVHVHVHVGACLEDHLGSADLVNSMKADVIVNLFYF